MVNYFGAQYLQRQRRKLNLFSLNFIIIVFVQICEINVSTTYAGLEKSYLFLLVLGNTICAIPSRLNKTTWNGYLLRVNWGTSVVTFMKVQKFNIPSKMRRATATPTAKSGRAAILRSGASCACCSRWSRWVFGVDVEKQSVEQTSCSPGSTGVRHEVPSETDL